MRSKAKLHRLLRGLQARVLPGGDMYAERIETLDFEGIDLEHVGEIGAAGLTPEEQLEHGEDVDTPEDAHHTRPTAGSDLIEDENGNFNFDLETQLSHGEDVDTPADAHHTRPSAGSDLTEDADGNFNLDTPLAHGNQVDTPTDAHHSRPAAGTDLSEDAEGNFNLDIQTQLNHGEEVDAPPDAHHSRPAAGNQLTEDVDGNFNLDISSPLQIPAQDLTASADDPATADQYATHDGSGSIAAGLYRSDPVNNQWVKVEDNAVTIAY